MKVTKFVHIIIFLSILCSFLSATIINVPGQYPTIQAGINASTDGDTVLVQPGIYYENINYNGHNIVVGSLFLTTQDSSYIEQTIINGSQNGSVITFESGEDSTAVLSGFTITNGYAFKGGGIFCHYSSPSLKNLIVSHNEAEDDGGGLWLSCSNSSLKYIYIFQNTALGNWDNGDGGGAYISASITDCSNLTFQDNYAADNGGGIACKYDAFMVLKNSLLKGNISGDNGGGIFFNFDANGSIEKCVLINNISYGGSGAIDLWSSDPWISNCTIHGNFSYGGAGGIGIWLDSCPNIINTIISNNSQYGIYFHSSSRPSIQYCDIYNNQTNFGGAFVLPNLGQIVQTNINGTPCDIYYNIFLDPSFIDPINGNYHLQENSPCIDAGNPNSPPDPDGTIADIGAYYFHQGVLLDADFIGEPLSGIIPLEVQFTDISTGNIIEWEWDFNYDGIIDSYLQNPCYIFNESGLYTVTLTVSDGDEDDTEIKIDYITVFDTLLADFEASPISGYVPLEVQFADLSIGNIIGWMWDFENDGVIDSNEQNPLFVYEQTGIYSIALTITDGFIEDTEIKLNYITVTDTTNSSNNVYPFRTKLNQNYPNPFNPETTIYFTTEYTENAELFIYNIKGQKIKRLIDKNLPVGKHAVVWDGKDSNGKSVVSGIYFYRLKVGDFEESRKMLLLK
jgi:parallel beta-helix repeat protein/predicted outer membrane repeat protein